MHKDSSPLSVTMFCSEYKGAFILFTQIFKSSYLLKYNYLLVMNKVDNN